MCVLIVALCVGCTADAPAASVRSQELRTSEEVFRMFCLRIARDEHPTDPDGLSFEAACSGTGPDAVVKPTPRLSALLARRASLIRALDQVFAQGGAEAFTAGSFEQGEITRFLASLIPLYDDLTLPKSTRALARVADKLLDPNEPRGQQVLATLARLSTRSGYRAPRDVLALIRPVLSYPRLDALSQELLGFVGEGGPAHDVFLSLLDALTLELAEPAEPVSEAAADSTTLHVAARLLLAEHESYKSPGDPSAFFVRRDLQGDAQRESSPSDPSVTPFPRANVSDATPRMDDGRARANEGSDALAFRYGDANRTLLAALMRDQKTLLERKEPGVLSTVEQLLRGLPLLLGARGPRSERFVVQRADPEKQISELQGSYAFTGPDVEHSPLLDLVHGLAQLLRYPETDRLLALLYELLDKHESEAAAPIYAALAVDRRADDHPEAQLVGVDGEPGTPHELWDDVIEIGMRMAQRPGLFRDVISALTTEQGVAQARLMARFMKFKDDVGFAPAFSVGADGRYSDGDVERLNALIAHDFGEPVMRMPGLDVGMNRSLFQRLVSTIQATNGAPNCNKEGAKLEASDPLTDTPLTFPDPTARDTGCKDDVLCEATRTAVFTAIDLVCPHTSDESSDAYKRCEFVEQANGAETHMRAILGRAEVKLKSPQLSCLAEVGLAGDLGSTQESSSQIGAFTLKPSAPAIARFMYVPRNTWLSGLFDPMPTVHGQSLTEYEPNLLFALEVKDKETQVAGTPLSFLDASRGLIEAFDQHEQFDDTAGGAVAHGGYLFADLLSVLHMHWSSRKQSDCPRASRDPDCALLGLRETACGAGCTQSRDPGRAFYAKQTNLVSYEPLLSEAFLDERLAELLALSSRALAGIRLTGEDGVTRDGITILGDFLERTLTSDPALSSFADKRGYVTTNSCVAEQFDAAQKRGTCGCPVGTQAADASDPRSKCLAADGRIVPRGRVLPEATPLHLVLDALRRFDIAFQTPDNEERLTLWRAARSALVDLFLSVDKAPDPGAPGDALKAEYRMQNPRARRTGMALVSFARERIKSYRDADPADDAALDRWALGLAGRLSSVLGHPITAGVLDLFDALWGARKADGPAHELSRFNAYLLDPANADTFADVALAAADSIELIDRDRALTPAIQFAALTLAEDAFSSLDSLAQSPEDPSSELGSAACSLEVSRKVADLNRGNSAPSTLSKLLSNAALPIDALRGQSALEVIFDAIADVNRADPSQSTAVAHSSDDTRAAFTQLRGFLADQDRGLERLYKVIENRRVK